jgi:hypothetical protein
MRIIKITQRQEDLLVMIHDGILAFQIAKVWKVKDATVSGHIAVLVKKELLVENLPRSCPKTYSLTLPAYEYLTLSREGSEDPNSHVVKYAGMHRISYRFDVEKWPENFDPDDQYDLKNWSPGKKEFPGFTMKINTRCIECQWDERDAETPKDAKVQSEMRSMIIKLKLEKAGFVFDGDPYLNRQPKHSILNDPFIRGLGPGYVEGEMFTKDDTPEDDTLHLKGKILGDPAKDTDAYLKMMLELPGRLARLEATFTDGFNRLFSLLETNIETTNKLIDKLTPKDLEESSQMYG